MTDKDGIDSNRIISIKCAECQHIMGTLVVLDEALVTDREVKQFLNVNNIIPVCPKCHDAAFGIYKEN
jgi:hypothetical protein